MTHHAHERRDVVVLTGASAGVGRATARKFAERGCAIALLARGAEGLEGAAKEVEEAGGSALPIECDVADAQQVEDAAQRTEEAFGPIDIWVNDAMITVFGPVTDITPEEFERVTAVTYLGTVYGTMAALRRMEARDRGTIVQVGSTLSYRAIPLQSAYCGAKHAVRGFTDSLRTELLHEDSKVDLTMVQLPALNTPQFEQNRAKLDERPQPVPPIYQPEVAADAIVWAAYHPRREMWVGTTSALTILGNKFAPGLLDRYLARNAYSAQKSDTDIEPGRADNLYSPVDEHRDMGAHGPYDEEARSYDPQVTLTKHRRLVGVAAAASAALAGIAAARSARSDGDGRDD